MANSKPQVIIDLEEYEALKKKAAEKDKELNYDEAYLLLFNEMVRGSGGAVFHIQNVINELNRNTKYSFGLSNINDRNILLNVSLKVIL